MSKVLKTIACSLIFLSAVACSDDDSGGEANAPSLSPGPGVFSLDFATSSSFFTRMSAPAPAGEGSPHGVMRMHYSTNMQDAVDLTAFTAPEGTIAIKTQGYDDAAENYTQILVMTKLAAGASPETNDWLYEMRDAEGNVMASSGDGDELMCHSCHSAFADVDGLSGLPVSN